MALRRSEIILAEVITALFVILFVYAAASKLLDYQNFKAQLGRSPLLARFWNWVWLVPVIELIISGMLPVPKMRLPALYASFSLMTMFTAYIFAITHFSEYVPCSCGGVLQKMSWTQHLWFNISFIILAVIGITIESRKNFIS